MMLLQTLFLLFLSKTMTASPVERVMERLSCPVCEPRFCPASAADCSHGMIADDCGCCSAGICQLSVGQRCLDAAHIPALSLTDLRVYAKCGSSMECKLRTDLDPLRNTMESVCMCLDNTPVCGSDRKTYSTSCEVEDRAGVRVAHRGPCAEAPRITVGPATTSARAGESVALGCEIYGVPVPNVIWQFDAFDGTTKMLPGDDVSTVVQSRGGPDSSMMTSWMQIVSARGEDSGTYTCIATNQNGRAQSKARLVVNGIF